MSESRRDSAPLPAGHGRRDDKRDRLASALRENLKRRKAQARRRAKTPAEGRGGQGGANGGG
jgi:hypothetical protein